MGNRNYSLDVVNKKQGNIEVIKYKNLLEIYLHRNLIFRADLDNKTLFIASCGYHTNSTRDAINTALRHYMPEMKVFILDGILQVKFEGSSQVYFVDDLKDKGIKF